MAETTSYGSQFWTAVRSPDWWDSGAATFDAAEQEFSELGKIVGLILSPYVPGRS